MIHPARWADSGASEPFSGLASGRAPFSLLDRADGPAPAGSPAQPASPSLSASPAPRGPAGPLPGGAAFAAWTLDSGPRSPGAARGHAGAALRGWGLAELVDDVAISVSEMVTNALCHSAEPWDPPHARPVMLSLLRHGGTVLCAVLDAGRSAPAVRSADELAESGRGLQIVDCLAEAWGWTAPGPAGKAVWARFSVAGSSGGEHAEALARLLLLSEILGTGRPA
ncbi:ATP-binding protein [Streptomyces sp. TRM 70351]|uniref:ATP-binding protein n=1 Tax=Streptomyces sp. TRM 70351 TaxID=3116552 RepID=UPI002E7B807E|nr:ATP-binding protein [Streptomyces sp. TRM 70351]MEE1928214.1 ATP-binding protein [Streptomyces sp. TRM 70351]